MAQCLACPRALLFPVFQVLSRCQLEKEGHFVLQMSSPRMLPFLPGWDALVRISLLGRQSCVSCHMAFGKQVSLLPARPKQSPRAHLCGPVDRVCSNCPLLDVHIWKFFDCKPQNTGICDPFLFRLLLNLESSFP